MSVDDGRTTARGSTIGGLRARATAASRTCTPAPIAAAGIGWGRPSRTSSTTA